LHAHEPGQAIGDESPLRCAVGVVDLIDARVADRQQCWRRGAAGAEIGAAAWSDVVAESNGEKIVLLDDAGDGERRRAGVKPLDVGS